MKRSTKLVNTSFTNQEKKEATYITNTRNRREVFTSQVIAIKRIIREYREQLFFSFLFLLFMAIPVAYESSQARGPVGAAAAGLHHSHSNVGSKLSP